MHVYSSAAYALYAVDQTTRTIVEEQASRVDISTRPVPGPGYVVLCDSAERLGGPRRVPVPEGTTARLVSPGSEYFAARWEIIAPA